MSTRSRSHSGRLLAAAAGVALAALGSAAQSPAPEPDGYWMGPPSGPVPASVKGGRVVRAAELIALRKRTAVVVVDVSNLERRPPGLGADVLWSLPPHAAIPGSHWLPGVGAGTLPASLEAAFGAQLERLTGRDLDRPVVLYCHARCWLSWNAAKRAVGYGYRHVYWFPDGIEGWRAAGQPTQVVKPD